MSSPDAHWRAALAEGRLLLQRPQGGGAAFFPPRLMAPGSGAGDLEWIEASGEGCVYSVTWVQQRPPAAAYNVVLIDLDEGPRLMSRVEGVDEANLPIGLRVRGFVDTSGDEPLLLFKPLEA